MKCLTISEKYSLVAEIPISLTPKNKKSKEMRCKRSENSDIASRNKNGVGLMQNSWNNKQKNCKENHLRKMKY